ncbi:PadR family transcriptional regulator [Actinotalea sp. C106]|uniref:PadR family transcriptional regulator n=1 Tax=Actinotalea sp. C106 TaxID=2908644 RepID=UPI002029046A|nr:PadR family transcriptional regulator [Actinotalea sp. C106]
MTSSASSTEFRRGVIGPCILALLATGPRYGLQIVKELDAVGNLLSSQGTVYPLLTRLSEAGLVSSHWDVDDGPRPRRYYSLTPAGREQLDTFREDWGRFTGAVDHVLAAAATTKEPV